MLDKSRKEAKFENRVSRKRLLSALLGRNVILARKARGFTQAELSKASGHTRVTIAKVEAGQVDPRLSTVADISSALGISPLLLLITGDELLSLSRLEEKTNPYQKAMSIDVSVLLTLMNIGTTSSMLKAAQLAIEQLSLGSGPEAAGAAIGTACAPGKGSAIGAALGELFQT